MKKYDAIVIGAGPSGSLFSFLLAKAGLQVLMIDKSNFPRPKVCGDCLNPKCWNIWERAGLAGKFRMLPHSVATSFSLSVESGKPLQIPLPDDTRELRSVCRETLDDWLRQEAVSAGAECLTGIRVQSMDFDRRLSTEAGEFHSKVLIGADGRNSWVARNGGFPVARIHCHRVAWQTNLTAHLADESIHMKFFREGYFGLVRHSAQSANLCMVLDNRASITPQKITNRFFPGNEHLTWRSIYPISRLPRPPARDNILLLGDAARVVEPFTGEGIYFALRTAELAADLVIDTYRKGGWANLERQYTDAHSRIYRTLSFHNGLTRYLGKRPSLGVWAAKNLMRTPALLRFLTRSFFTSGS